MFIGCRPESIATQSLVSASHSIAPALGAGPCACPVPNTGRPQWSLSHKVFNFNYVKRALMLRSITKKHDGTLTRFPTLNNNLFTKCFRLLFTPESPQSPQIKSCNQCE